MTVERLQEIIENAVVPTGNIVYLRQCHGFRLYYIAGKGYDQLLEAYEFQFKYNSETGVVLDGEFGYYIEI